MTTYRFTQLTDIGEGDRLNPKTKKCKRDYLGKECRIISDIEPYGMQFRDGAVWALSRDQFIPIEESKGLKWKGVRYDKVVCIETQDIYDSPFDAGLAVGKSAKSIRTACDYGSTINGLHFDYL